MPCTLGSRFVHVRRRHCRCATYGVDGSTPEWSRADRYSRSRRRRWKTWSGAPQLLVRLPIRVQAALSALSCCLCCCCRPRHRGAGASGSSLLHIAGLQQCASSQSGVLPVRVIVPLTVGNIGVRMVVSDDDQLDGGTWRCRNYFYVGAVTSAGWQWLSQRRCLAYFAVASCTFKYNTIIRLNR